jgi:hypothetical protein
MAARFHDASSIHALGRGCSDSRAGETTNGEDDDDDDDGGGKTS